MSFASSLACRFLGRGEKAARSLLGGLRSHGDGDAVGPVQHDSALLGAGDASASFGPMGFRLFDHLALSLAALTGDDDEAWHPNSAARRNIPG
jgi:hypothetical protein